MDRCPVCSGLHRACGPRSTSSPVDQQIIEGVTGMPLNRYEVRQPNGTVSVLQLDDADAKRLGVFKEPEASTKKAPAPANKSRTAKTKKA